MTQSHHLVQSHTVEAAAPVAGRPSGRAREPDAEGWAVRDGIKLAWATYGDPGLPTVLLMPTWSIVDSRVWKAQVGYLARHFHVVTFDGRGCGRSDRPTEASLYADDAFGEDAIAVLDAVGVDRAVLVGFSCGVTFSLHAAARHPERVAGLFGIAPSCGLGFSHPERELYHWDRVYETTEGWAKYNRDYWRRGGYPDFVRFFMAQLFSEPHSTKQIEDTIGVRARCRPRDRDRVHRRSTRLQRCRLSADRADLLRGPLSGRDRARAGRPDPADRHRSPGRRAHRR